MAMALAEVPQSVRPHVAPIDAQAQHDAWHEGRGEPRVPLACEPLWPDVASLCWKWVPQGQTRRWATQVDLADWGQSPQSLRAEMTARALAVAVQQLKVVQVTQTAHSYWVSGGADGWQGAPVLVPGLITRHAGGGRVYFGAPSVDALLMWRGGDAERDRILTVGVRQIHDSRKGSISPMVHTWDGARWLAVGQAVPAEVAP